MRVAKIEDAGTVGCRGEADEDGFFSSGIKAIADVTILSVELDRLSGGALFNKLSDSTCGVVDDERAVFLQGDVGGRFGGGMANQREEDKRPNNTIYSGLPNSHPYIKGIKILSVEPCPKALVAILSEITCAVMR